ncbi:hypothetical protein CALCODRAFT_475940 [Calocera cornea HHB12733]|uniref:Protein kinase domain-containing protein n=1 Tax=Calocera cornea HHB12733 TaxID=1353952 RepID=A0A165DB93_9BASI|nr:hypothetical protein CALCODRAFT_475940 [Calocera cornea HHB12733]
MSEQVTDTSWTSKSASGNVHISHPTIPPGDPPATSEAGPSAEDNPVDVHGPYALSNAEGNWSRVQETLESMGYMLRPRYRPGWIGSWIGTKRRPESCEDSIGLVDHQITLDAVRMSDGSQVLLKIWNQSDRDGPELSVLEYFSDPSRVNDPQNHCIPLLDKLRPEGFSHALDLILVEPLFRTWDEPPLVMVAEGLCFILQVLEGLEYMHAHNVAHGDIHGGNILMDPRPIFPDGFHGAFTLNPYHRMPETRLRRFTRIQAPVKYYYIDFGSSSMFSSYEERKPVRLTAAAYLPPEFFANKNAPLDPFKQDVFALGMTLIGHIRHRPGLHFTLTAFEGMIDNNPDDRPTIAQVKTSFVRLLRSVKPRQMRGRIGWTWSSGHSLRQRLWEIGEYFRLLYHSYRFGLPTELFPERPIV